MQKRPLILITNDDGIQSPGLRAAARAVADLGDLLIVAPNKQQTGASRSYPFNNNQPLEQTTVALNGSTHPAHTGNMSPAQSVTVGVLYLARRPVDLVISGINYGENVGSGVTISGTVGAAIEAGCYGIPALAVSLQTPHEHHFSNSDVVDFSVAAHFTRQFAQKVLQNGLPANVDLLKIDVPASATVETPWQFGRVSRQRYYETPPGNFEKVLKGESKLAYHVNVQRDSLEPDSDVKIFSVDRHVSVVPMTVDLTAPVTLADVSRFYNHKK